MSHPTTESPPMTTPAKDAPASPVAVGPLSDTHGMIAGAASPVAAVPAPTYVPPKAKYPHLATREALEAEIDALREVARKALNAAHEAGRQGMQERAPSRDATPRFASTSCSQCGGEFGPGDSGFSHCSDHAAPVERALSVAAEPVLSGCNCRWKGDEQVEWCELHLAHRDAIHEWAARAKSAESALNRFHHVMKDHGLHPGRTDDDLLDILATHLSALNAQRTEGGSLDVQRVLGAVAREPLTEGRIEDCIDAANRKFNGRNRGPCGQMMTTFDDWKHWLVREVEQAHGIGAAPTEGAPTASTGGAAPAQLAEQTTKEAK